MNKNNEAEKAMAEIDEMISKLEAIRSAKKERAKPRNGSVIAKVVDDGAKTSVELEVIDMTNENIHAVMSSLIEVIVDGKDNHAEVMAEFTAKYLINLARKQTDGNS